jgi:two-component system CheB/CheR fusion protein
MTEAPLDVLLEYLRRTRGFDFSGYKRSSLERRILKRMDEVGAKDYVEYRDRLEVQPDEFALLFDTILINVTSFFRDGPAWDYLGAEVLPALLSGMDGDEPIRVWSAGCASGEEAYSVAILLAEAMGEQAYLDRVKIYATDVDEQALEAGRHASYPVKSIESLPREILDRYFDRGEQRYVFRKDLRRTVIFGRNDLVQDAPISRIDLLTCRNTLMYFNAETQDKILARFNFALNDRGYLFLGKSEMLVAHGELFQPVSPKWHVFRKVARPGLRDRLLNVTHGHWPGPHPVPAEALREGIVDASPMAQIAVDADGIVVMANRRARDLFHLVPSDIGRPLKDLEISYRPADLRSNLDLAYRQRRQIVLDHITAAVASGDVRDLEVRVSPVVSEDAILGASIVFVDVTHEHRVQEELETSRRELENAYEELQSTVEELETTNEELQSTNEELETTNEELQSTNEELETMNEELQSTNEELETINDELRLRSFELNQVNGFLETILTSLGVAVVVVDASQVVQIWNAHSSDLWGLRPEEVEGQRLPALDIGLPLDRVEPVVEAVLVGREERGEVEVEARDRRGRAFECRVTCMPLVADHREIAGVIVLMEDVAAAAQARDGDR